MKKFELQSDTGYFTIDPAHLKAGLAAAATKKHTAIRVMAMDFRSTKLAFDSAALLGQSFIRKLVLDDELTPDAEAATVIQSLQGLEEITLRQWAALDFSTFPKLQSLVLSKGSALQGIDKLSALKQLYLIDWQEPELPKQLAQSSVGELRISASKKLSNVDALAKMVELSDLTLQDLPKLQLPKKLEIKSLTRLNVEKCAWRDFSFLRSKALVDLELFTTFESLAFLKQLPALKRLYIWECSDGDMNPVLSHATLEEIYFDKNRKHYTHKEAQLQAALRAKR